MKLCSFIITIFLLCQATFTQAVTLTFTIANPQVVNNGSAYRFDVLMRASAPGTYHFRGMVYLHFNSVAFGTAIAGQITLEKLTLLNEKFSGNDKYSIVKIADNQPSLLAITWEGNYPSHAPSASRHTAVPTTATGLMRITIPFVDASQAAGISFQPSLMNGEQYRITAPNTNQAYSNPNNYEILVPNCAQLTTPAHQSSNVSVTTPISWSSSSGNPTGYALSIGTSLYGSDILGKTDLGLVNTYTPSLPLPYNTSIYVTIVPYNAHGENTSCPSHYFKTVSCIPGLLLENQILQSKDYRSQGQLTARQSISPFGKKVFLISDQSILLEHDFQVELGNTFEVKTEPCSGN